MATRQVRVLPHCVYSYRSRAFVRWTILTLSLCICVIVSWSFRSRLLFLDSASGAAVTVAPGPPHDATPVLNVIPTATPSTTNVCVDGLKLFVSSLAFIVLRSALLPPP